MNFHGLNVENGDFYLDVAFRRARKCASGLVSKKDKELARLDEVNSYLCLSLGEIVSKFPVIKQLDPFYRDLCGAVLDVNYLKQSLGALNWAVEQLKSMRSFYAKKIKMCRNFADLPFLRKQYYGRTASVLKQVNKHLLFIQECKRAMENFPVIKTKMPTVVLAGFPNVGKSTLIGELTGSRPKVAAYPFTTQQIMLGYRDDVQFVDTPGMLDRPFNKRNKIELQAFLALKHLADVVVVLVDSSESCGYELSEQKKLLKDIEEHFEKVLVVCTKSDIPGQEFKCDARVSSKDKQSVEGLFKLIMSKLDKE